MSLESDISTIKDNAKQLASKSRDMKSDLDDMKRDIAKLKENDPGPLITILKSAAFISALGKIDGLSQKVDKLNVLAREKADQTKALRDAEARKANLIEEQNRNFKQAQELKLTEQKQCHEITQYWIKYQEALAEPDLLKRYFFAETNFGENLDLDISLVKDSVLLEHYTELRTCRKTLLNAIKAELGEAHFKVVADAYDAQNKLHKLASEPQCTASYIEECKALLKKIDELNQTAEGLSFSAGELHVISEQIKKFTSNASLLAAFMLESKKSNVATADVFDLFRRIAPEYQISAKDLLEIYTFNVSNVPTISDWCLFFEYAQKHIPDSFSEDMQKYLDFLADKAGKEHINLRKAISRRKWKVGIVWNIIAAIWFVLGILAAICLLRFAGMNYWVVLSAFTVVFLVPASIISIKAR